MKSNYLFRVHDIPHYYGDRVRGLLLGAAVLAVVAIPLYGDLLPFGVFVQVGSVLLLVLLAGLTNPHSSTLIVCDAIASGIGAFLLESAAISFYATDSIQLFAAREAAALLLLLAFYYSIKTLRALWLGKLGRLEKPWEFEDTQDK